MAYILLLISNRRPVSVSILLDLVLLRLRGLVGGGVPDWR